MPRRRAEPGSSARTEVTDVAERNEAPRWRRHNVVVQAGVLLLGLAYLLGSLRLPLGSTTQPGPGLFPTLVGFMLTGFGVAALVEELGPSRAIHHEPQPGDVSKEGRDEGGEFGTYGEGGASWRVAVIIGMLIVYVVTAPLFGHIPVTVGMSTVVIRILAPRPWWQILAVSLLLAFGSSLIFEQLLGMRLPTGRLL